MEGLYPYPSPSSFPHLVIARLLNPLRGNLKSSPAN
jgi:hypothetical protein